MSLLIIVAARNEAERIGATLEALAAAFPDAAVWVADDASTDGTAEVAARHGAAVATTGSTRGKGGNVTAAALEAQPSDRADARRADQVVLLCDADLGASAGRLDSLVAAVTGGECDLAIASFARRVGGGFGAARGAGGWAIRRLCGAELEAPLSGQRAMRAEVLRGVLPFADGFGMEVGMTVDAIRAGHSVREVEVDLEHRATGRTLGGFAHRARQLLDILRAYSSRRRP